MLRASKKFYFLAGVTAIAVVALALYFGSSVIALTTSADKPATEQASREAAPLQLTEEERKRAGIKVERIEPAQYADVVQAFGTVSANRNRYAKVAPPVAGRVSSIAADLGDKVRAGTVLVALDSPELAELRSTYHQSRTEADLAKSTLDRAQKLAADGTVAQKDLLRAQSDYQRAQAALAAVEAKLQTLSVAATAPAGSAPSYFAVVSPMDGTIVERTAVLGEYVQAYQSLFAVADLSVVWVETSLYDRDLSEVEIGAPATVSVSGQRDRRFSGKIAYIGNLLDKDTRTVLARVEVPNPDGRLKPGMFADVEIDAPGHRSALRVPANAVVLLQGQNTVFIAKRGGFEATPVEIGERPGGSVIVKSGLMAGDEVVTEGAYALKARFLKSLIGEGHE